MSGQVGEDVFYVDEASFQAAKIVGVSPAGQDRMNLLLFPDEAAMLNRVEAIWPEGAPGAPSQYPNWTRTAPS